MPAALEHAKQLGRDFAQRREDLKSTHPQLMIQSTKKSYIKTPRRSQSLEKVGRPTLEIRDVGGKFLDLNDSLKRISMAQKRISMAQKRILMAKKQTKVRLRGRKMKLERRKKRCENRRKRRLERRKAEVQS